MNNSYSGSRPPVPAPPATQSQPKKKSAGFFGIKTLNAIVIIWLVAGVFLGASSTSVAGGVFLKNRCDSLAEKISLPTKNGDNTCLVYYNKKWIDENVFMGALFQR